MTFITDENDKNLHAYIRSYNGERIIVITNLGKGREAKSFSLNLGQATCLLRKNAKYAIKSGVLTVELSPKGYVILKA